MFKWLSAGYTWYNVEAPSELRFIWINHFCLHITLETHMLLTEESNDKVWLRMHKRMHINEEISEEEKLRLPTKECWYYCVFFLPIDKKMTFLCKMSMQLFLSMEWILPGESPSPTSDLFAYWVFIVQWLKVRSSRDAFLTLRKQNKQNIGREELWLLLDSGQTLSFYFSSL